MGWEYGCYSTRTGWTVADRAIHPPFPSSSTSPPRAITVFRSACDGGTEAVTYFYVLRLGVGSIIRQRVPSVGSIVIVV